MGSIGYDVDNFGSKSGTFSYTLTAADFNNSNETLLTDFSPKILFDVNGDGILSGDGSDDVFDLYTADLLSEPGDPFIDFYDKVLDLNGDGTITILDALVDADGDGSLTADDADDTGIFAQAVSETNYLDAGDATKAIFVTADNSAVLDILAGGTQKVATDGTLTLPDTADAVDIDVTSFKFATIAGNDDLYAEAANTPEAVIYLSLIHI